MADKKLNNLVDFHTYSEKDLFKDNKPTKRTGVAKDVLKEDVNEKWGKDVEVKSTGEHAGKTIEELKGELRRLKIRSKKYQEQGKKVPKSIIDQEAEINFAIRAKKDWK